MRRDRSTITVRNLPRTLPVNVSALQGFAEEALSLVLRLRSKRATPLQRLRDIYILLISDQRMSTLHRRFLGEAGPTDVITFEHGEIFISVETAKRHARRFRNSLERELQLYIVHGLLHLHGFNDRQPAAARRMEVAQEKIVKAARDAAEKTPRAQLV